MARIEGMEYVGKWRSVNIFLFVEFFGECCGLDSE